MSSYLDNRLAEPERRSIAVHLAICAECSAHREQLSQLRNNLRSMPILRAPNRLATDLQVLASREIVRRRRTASVPAFLHFWADRVKLLMDNMMRPIALPFAGGLASALVIFGTLVPSLGFLRSSLNDKPSALYTEASVDNVADFASRSKNSDDTVIEVQIDGQGRMVNYNVIQGQMTSEMGNLLLFTTFTPATMFLQPTSGKIVIRRSQIVVKG